MTVYSVLDLLFLRPPPFQHVERLVHVFDINPQKIEPGVDLDPSPGNFLDWREQLRSFDRMAAWRNWYYTLAGTHGAGDSPESLRGVRISPRFFEMLGMQMSLGRTFEDNEEKPGNDRVVILGHQLWKRRFNGDPAVIGQTVHVDGLPYIVVGVLPGWFQFLQPDLDIWMPLTVDESFHNRQNHSVIVIARLTPNVTLNQAQVEMDAVTAKLAESYPVTNAGWGARLAPLHPNYYLRHLRPGLRILLGAAALILLIACANVANLVLVRTITRRREFAVRAAIGASRARLICQTLTESLVLGGLGAAVGCVLAYVGVHRFLSLLPHGSTNYTVTSYASTDSMAIDFRVLIFIVFVGVMTGVMCGILPALQGSKGDLLKLSANVQRRALVGRSLIVTEIALSVVLLFGASLLLESFWMLRGISPGFRPEHVLTMQVSLPKTEYSQPSRVAAFYRQVLERIETSPGVGAAGAVNFRPFLGMGSRTNIEVQGWTPADPRDANPITPYRVVSPGYLAALGQPLFRGRDLANGDQADSAGVALVNQAMATRFWPNENPIGKRIRPAFHHTDVPWDLDAAPRWLTVVGVVGNIKEFRVSDHDYPEFYVSYLQFPSRFMYLVVRSKGDPESLATAIRSAVQAVDAGRPVALVQTMETAISRSVAQPRFNLVLLGIFAVIALLLSTAGVYALTSYSVGQRAKEIAIRVALGANASSVSFMFMREVVILGGIGVVIGMIAALSLVRVMSNLLYGVSPFDARAITITAFVLLTIALLAGGIPARRAASVDPMAGLRCD